MENRIIDARSRFGATKQKKAPLTETELRHFEAERAEAQLNEAIFLRSELKKTSRLDKPDRKVLARNLGRAIERQAGARPTQVASQLFKTLWGEEGGATREKKRKRYIRFEGEATHDGSPDADYAATRADFLRLIEGLADMQGGPLSQSDARDQMLSFVCDGTSFGGPSRPRLGKDGDAFARFRQTMDSLMDKLCNETELVTYFDEMSKLPVRSYPNIRTDFSDEVLCNLHKSSLPVQRFDFVDEFEQFDCFNRIKRLNLDGLHIPDNQLPPHVPRIRLARVYWPRRVLCLPIGAETSTLNDLETRALNFDEETAAIAEYVEYFGEYGLLRDESNEEIRRNAIRRWREKEEYKLGCSILESAGLSPDIKWENYFDPQTAETFNDATWRIFWDASSVDLYIVAEGRPDNVQFGLHFPDIHEDHWSHASKELAYPSLDDSSFGLNYTCSAEGESFAWFQDVYTGQSYISRGLIHFTKEYPYQTYDEIKPDDLYHLNTRPLWSIYSPEGWEFLSRPTKDWRSEHPNQGLPSSEPPSLRPLFTSPTRWTPAPGNSLASAILSSLSYGEGEERLDQKLIAAINSRVRCLRDMKQRLSHDFEAGLQQHGYTPKG